MRAVVLSVKIVAILGNGGLDLAGLVAHEDAGRSVLVGVRVALEDGPGGPLLFECDKSKTSAPARLLVDHNDRVGDFAELAPEEFEFLFRNCGCVRIRIRMYACTFVRDDPSAASAKIYQHDTLT